MASSAVRCIVIVRCRDFLARATKGSRCKQIGAVGCGWVFSRRSSRARAVKRKSLGSKDAAPARTRATAMMFASTASALHPAPSPRIARRRRFVASRAGAFRSQERLVTPMMIAPTPRRVRWPRARRAARAHASTRHSGAPRLQQAPALAPTTFFAPTWPRARAMPRQRRASMTRSTSRARTATPYVCACARACPARRRRPAAVSAMAPARPPTRQAACTKTNWMACVATATVSRSVASQGSVSPAIASSVLTTWIALRRLARPSVSRRPAVLPERAPTPRFLARSARPRRAQQASLRPLANVARTELVWLLRPRVVRRTPVAP